MMDKISFWYVVSCLVMLGLGAFVGWWGRSGEIDHLKALCDLLKGGKDAAVNEVADLKVRLRAALERLDDLERGRAMVGPAADVLKEADALVDGDRKEDYGEAAASFERIADLWKPVLGMVVEPRQVVLCMIALKVSRAKASSKRDSWVDIAGYAKLGAMLDEAKEVPF